MEIRGIRGRRIWCGIGCADVGWDVGAGAASCNFNFIDRTDDVSMNHRHFEVPFLRFRIPLGLRIRFPEDQGRQSQA